MARKNKSKRQRKRIAAGLLSAIVVITACTENRSVRTKGGRADQLADQAEKFGLYSLSEGDKRVGLRLNPELTAEIDDTKLLAYADFGIGFSVYTDDQYRWCHIERVIDETATYRQIVKVRYRPWGMGIYTSGVGYPSGDMDQASYCQAPFAEVAGTGVHKNILDNAEALANQNKLEAFNFVSSRMDGEVDIVKPGTNGTGRYRLSDSDSYSLFSHYLSIGLDHWTTKGKSAFLVKGDTQNAADNSLANNDPVAAIACAGCHGKVKTKPTTRETIGGVEELVYSYEWIPGFGDLLSSAAFHTKDVVLNPSAGEPWEVAEEIRALAEEKVIEQFEGEPATQLNAMQLGVAVSALGADEKYRLAMTHQEINDTVRFSDPSWLSFGAYYLASVSGALTHSLDDVKNATFPEGTTNRGIVNAAGTVSSDVVEEAFDKTPAYVANIRDKIMRDAGGALPQNMIGTPVSLDGVAGDQYTALSGSANATTHAEGYANFRGTFFTMPDASTHECTNSVPYQCINFPNQANGLLYPRQAFAQTSKMMLKSFTGLAVVPVAPSAHAVGKNWPLYETYANQVILNSSVPVDQLVGFNHRTTGLNADTSEVTGAGYYNPENTYAYRYKDVQYPREYYSWMIMLNNMTPDDPGYSAAMDGDRVGQRKYWTKDILGGGGGEYLVPWAGEVGISASVANNMPGPDGIAPPSLEQGLSKAGVASYESISAFTSAFTACQSCHSSISVSSVTQPDWSNAYQPEVIRTFNPVQEISFGSLSSQISSEWVGAVPPINQENYLMVVGAYNFRALRTDCEFVDIYNGNNPLGTEDHNCVQAGFGTPNQIFEATRSHLGFDENNVDLGYRNYRKSPFNPLGQTQLATTVVKFSDMFSGNSGGMTNLFLGEITPAEFAVLLNRPVWPGTVYPRPVRRTAANGVELVPLDAGWGLNLRGSRAHMASSGLEITTAMIETLAVLNKAYQGIYSGVLFGSTLACVNGANEQITKLCGLAAGTNPNPNRDDDAYTNIPSQDICPDVWGSGDGVAQVNSVVIGAGCVLDSDTNGFDDAIDAMCELDPYSHPDCYLRNPQ